MFDRKPKPEQAFTANIASAKTMRTLIEQTLCPACNQQTLTLSRYTTGEKGWEADVKCDNCNFKGTVNSTGFQFSRIDSKGKARE